MCSHDPWPRLRRLTLAAASTFALLACDRGDVATPAPNVPSELGAIAAAVDGEPITLTRLDAPLRIELHDLEVAGWEARRRRLEFLVRSALGPDAPPPGSPVWDERVEWHLDPPEPPRFALPVEGATLVGSPLAPVTLTVFVDYASSHVRRLQPYLVRLRDLHGDRLRLAVRQHPLAYHRHARIASRAALCAEAQGRFDDFDDVLLDAQPDQSDEALRELAVIVGLKPRSFDSCLDDAEIDRAIDRDLALARGVGVRRAPTIFVNGRYVAGRPEFDVLDTIVRDELERAGVSPPAVVEPRVTAETDDVRGDATDPLPEIPPGRLAEPERVISLGRDEVDAALAERRQIQAELRPTRGEFSGERLLKVRDGADQPFLARLGLEPGDVLVAVNGAFVTVAHDGFLDAFATGDVVRILVMRRGRPHSWEYRIRDDAD